MLRKRKAQAAMEFLMTYGWAILAAIIVIGAISYLYISKMGNQNVGTLNAPFYLQAFTISATDGLTLEIQNKGGETINATSATIGACSDIEFDNNTDCESTSTFISIAPGGKAYICAETTDCGITSGEPYKGDILVNYKRPNSNINLASSGSIAGTAVA